MVTMNSLQANMNSQPGAAVPPMIVPRPRTAENEPSPLPGMIGNSAAMREVFNLARLAAPSKASVLIFGETGTGKELVARAIWQLSNRAEKPYVRVNCGALHENLLESELFGHVKGSFTGAIENKIGRFAAAHQGTIFLDEVNSMSAALQVKLLRVLQEGTFERVGDTQVQSVDVRVIAASNELLRPKIAAGQFREDLYFRLNVVPIFLPPLCNRKEDIEPLARFFLEKHSRANGFETPELTEELLRELQGGEWPGNIRELENVIERLVVLSRGGPAPAGVLHLDQPRFPFRGLAESADDDVPALLRRAVRLTVDGAGAGSEGLYGQFIQVAERELLTHVMALADGVQSKAAKMLGINRNTLAKKLGEVDTNDEPDFVI
jgi:Nif-specific regulatory protein